MALVQQDVIIEQGATFQQLWEIDNKQLATGYTFSAKFRPSHSSSTVLFTLSSTGSPATLTVAHVGQHTHVTANYAASLTAAFGAPSDGVYDLEYTQTSTSVVTRAAEGSYYVTPESTR